ncbi:MAG: riboflavin synthase [Betaproteobacteria bacterium]|nr:riboflavin synthase [Betaproteobacteria bacterium]
MFTGIIAAVGRISDVSAAPGGARVRIASGALALDDVKVGDSIAVDGACLTVVALDGRSFSADVSRETMTCTAGFAAGARVNLEKALRLDERLGGHLVTGHVDGVGEVRRVVKAGDNRQLTVAAPGTLAKLIARKGSIAVNGVSLTVNAVSGAEFTVNLIPHTLQATNLQALKAGDRVNLEADLLARYVERMRETGAGG